MGNGHWQKCTQHPKRRDSSSSSHKLDGSSSDKFDGKWIEEKPDSKKIYDVKKLIVKETDGPDEGKITPLGKDKLSLTIGENKLEGTHMLPEDKIEWEGDRVWRRFQDDGGDENTKEEKKTNMLNGMWIDKNKDDEPLEKIQEIYSIENEKVTDGENEAPIKISDTDKVEIEKEFQDKTNWKGTHEDRGAIP